MRILDNKTLQACIAYGAILFTGVNNVAAARIETLHIGGIMLPDAFRNALRDGMNIPLYIHLNGTKGTQDDQRIGNASIWLDSNTLRVRLLQLQDQDGNASLNDNTRSKIVELADTAFDRDFKIPLTQHAWLHLNFQQLALQLVVNPQALTTLLRSRGEDIGVSSVNNLSSTLGYNLGVYNNKMRGGNNNTSSYLSLDSVTALREHHAILDGTLYGIGSNNQQTELYRAIYERDFAGYRFAGGMLDTWNLQSLGPVTALPSGKIYGFSWGNQAQSTIFNNSHSVIPVVVFLPSAGEIHLSRDGKLLSVQNFGMGSHEVDTTELPYGIYDVNVDVVVNGQTVSKTVQRINKLFAREGSAGLPLRWQIWGGNMHIESWDPGYGKIQRSEDSLLMGISASGGIQSVGWMASTYGYNSTAVGEFHFSWPIADYLQINTQNMLATDGSWSAINSLNATLPGNFSSIWLSQEKTSAGNKLRRSDASNVAVGSSLNLRPLWSKLGTLSASYNEDRQHNSHYYTADYTQTLYSGGYGSVGLRAGLQRYQNSFSSNVSTMQKYIALDFMLPLGSLFRAGLTQQNGYSMANLSAQNQFNDGAIHAVGADISRAISGVTGSNKSLNAGAWTQYETRYSAGTLSINSGVDGYVSTNLTSSGSLGWQGKEFGISGNSEGNAGVILRTDVEDDGQLTAKINGRVFPLKGKRNYLPLDPYGRYEIEILNSKNSLDSYNISGGRKNHLTLYPGNVVLISPEIKQMVTVSGRIRAENGTLLTNARINNHIGRTRTDSNGEFVMDVDKKFPTIDFNYDENKVCAAEFDISKARGAVWLGDIICQGLKTFANVMSDGVNNEI
ncbi:CS1-pili formation C-terminal domain-containing protein [Kosakonia calanthes]|uniref:CS1-pili formation C-terminal domain-containing protein n=1 Tax=Kosakonia calanthes TaxID=3139408 RepID=UPI003CC7D811